MFAILWKHKILTILIFTFLLLSILCQITAGVIYQSMIAEADNMSATKNKILKQCKQKYANYYKLNGKMVNTAAFVDKFLQKICILRIPLGRFSHVAGQMMMLSVLATGVSVCLSLAAGDTLFQIIPYYLVSILGLYLYFSVAGLMDLQEKQKALKINLMDYLENHLIPRLEIEKEVSLEEGAKKREQRVNAFLRELEETDEEADLQEVDIQQRDSGNTERVSPAAAGYEDELESLLEEFFA
ncbi:MAG: hypothetical protein IJ409_09750 [Lachnospiraceae bacterium]|nr:hypothetical protein [Lachnospiraceae bacterium]